MIIESSLLFAVGFVGGCRKCWLTVQSDNVDLVGRNIEDWWGVHR